MREIFIEKFVILRNYGNVVIYERLVMILENVTQHAQLEECYKQEELFFQWKRKLSALTKLERPSCGMRVCVHH
ncbi:MAG: hypothetical protein FWG02_02030 [Holophagaceae bacterium]|nr:hypothetical protein [Holophagaceae bacterium]